MDFEAKELGVSDRICDWAARWCRTHAQGKIEVASFREGLGRLAFAAGPLRFVRPFPGPLCAWCAAVGGQRSADPPPLVVLVLEWLAEEFEKRRTSYVPSTKALWEMFRSDAKAGGQKVVVGGWELAGSERACDARWFALELSSAEIPWAYERGDPFKAISAWSCSRRCFASSSSACLAVALLGVRCP